MNRHARQLVKFPLLLADLFSPTSRNGYTFLIYHAVTGQIPLELDLEFVQFRRQLTWLAHNRQVISFAQALADLRAGRSSDGPRFVLTFDDGYRDFYTHVFPLLCEFNLPAILYVNTGFVEEGVPYPIRRHNPSNVQAVTWEMLAEMAASGLVTLGAHTHTHPDLSQISPQQAGDELAGPIELLRQKVGVDAHHFCYPRALWDPQVEEAVARYYETAVIGGGRSVTPACFHPYRIPRLPIRRSDGWLFFRAKMNGWLQHEESFYGLLHRSQRS